MVVANVTHISNTVHYGLHCYNLWFKSFDKFSSYN